MEKSRLRVAAPTSVNVTVGRRSREYLTEREVERLIEAAKQNRSGHRDATAILVAYRHGLRASEIVALRWDDIDLTTGRLHVRRAKGGDASVHPISALWPRNSPFPFIPTCCGTPAGSRWPPRATTPVPCKPTSDTRTSSTRCGIPSCHLGSRAFGGIDDKILQLVSLAASSQQSA